MYLCKKTYVQNWSHRPTKVELNVEIEGKPIPIDTSRVSYIIEQVAVWRKFNALHGYIVEEFGNGDDNCREIPIDLRILLDKLKQIDKTNAAEVMPTASGFFFGSQDYDEYYYDEVAYTIQLFEDLLKEDNSNADYYYQASW